MDSNLLKVPKKQEEDDDFLRSLSQPLVALEMPPELKLKKEATQIPDEPKNPKRDSFDDAVDRRLLTLLNHDKVGEVLDQLYFVQLEIDMLREKEKEKLSIELEQEDTPKDAIDSAEEKEPSVLDKVLTRAVRAHQDQTLEADSKGSSPFRDISPSKFATVDQKRSLSQQKPRSKGSNSRQGSKGKSPLKPSKIEVPDFLAHAQAGGIDRLDFHSKIIHQLLKKHREMFTEKMEVDWFEFEIRARRLVAKLLGPLELKIPFIMKHVLAAQQELKSHRELLNDMQVSLYQKKIIDIQTKSAEAVPDEEVEKALKRFSKKKFEGESLLKPVRRRLQRQGGRVGSDLEVDAVQSEDSDAQERKKKEAQRARKLSLLASLNDKLAYALPPVKTTSIFNRYDEKLEQLESLTAGLKSGLERQAAEAQANNDQFKQELTRAKERILELEGLEDMFGIKLDDLQAMFEKQQQSMVDTFDRRNDSQEHQLRLVHELQNKILREEQDLVVQNDQIRESHQQLEKRSRSLEASMGRLGQQLNMIETTKADQAMVDDSQQLISTKLAKAVADMDKKHSRLVTVERYVDKYLPIKVQAQLHESLHSCLTHSMLFKLESFELSKFRELNEAVLDEDATDFGEEVKKMLHKVLQAIDNFEKEEAKRLKIIKPQQNKPTVEEQAAIKLEKIYASAKEQEDLEQEEGKLKANEQDNKASPTLTRAPPMQPTTSSPDQQKVSHSEKPQLQGLKSALDLGSIPTITSQESNGLCPAADLLLYLESQDFAKEIDLRELVTQDKIELSFDEEMLNCNVSQLLKIMKVILCNQGMLAGKHKLILAEHHQAMTQLVDRSLVSFREQLERVQMARDTFLFEKQNIDQIREQLTALIQKVSKRVDGTEVQLRELRASIPKPEPQMKGVDYCLAYLSEYLSISSTLDKEIFSQIDAKGMSIYDLAKQLSTAPPGGVPFALKSTRNVIESTDSLTTPHLGLKSRDTDINNSRDISTVLNSQLEQQEDEPPKLSGGLLLEEALKTTKLKRTPEETPRFVKALLPMKAIEEVVEHRSKPLRVADLVAMRQVILKKFVEKTKRIVSNEVFSELQQVFFAFKPEEIAAKSVGTSRLIHLAPNKQINRKMTSSMGFLPDKTGSAALKMPSSFKIPTVTHSRKIFRPASFTGHVKGHSVGSRRDQATSLSSQSTVKLPEMKLA